MTLATVAAAVAAVEIETMKTVFHYFAALKFGKCVLWCYLIWYLVTVKFHFDPAPKIWINSLGISAVIGCGLMLSVAANTAASTHWQTVRLFLMPFCVSSFSALIKDRGFIFVFSSNLTELSTAFLSCALFLMSIFALKSIDRMLKI